MNRISRQDAAAVRVKLLEGLADETKLAYYGIRFFVVCFDAVITALVSAGIIQAAIVLLTEAVSWWLWLPSWWFVFMCASRFREWWEREKILKGLQSMLTKEGGPHIWPPEGT